MTSTPAATRPGAHPPTLLGLAIVLAAGCSRPVPVDEPGEAASAKRTSETESDHLDTWTNDRFQRPFRIAQDSRGLIYVTDIGARGIHVLSAEGGYVRFITRVGNPLGIAVDARDRLVVGDGERHQVVILDSEGEVYRVLGGDQEVGSPQDIAIHTDGSIFVTDATDSSIVKFSPEGEVLLSFGTLGLEDGTIRVPTGIAIAESTGEVFVADGNRGRINVYDAEGVWLRSIGQTGIGDGYLARTQGLAVPADGERVFAAASLQGAVSVFSKEGAFSNWISEHGSGPGELRIPIDLLIDDNSRLLVTSYFNRNIEVFGLDDSYSDPPSTKPALGLAEPRSVNRLGAPFQLTVFLDVPTSDVAIDPETIRLGDLIPTEVELPDEPFVRRGTHFEAQATFWMAEVLNTWPDSGPMDLPITGQLEDGTDFDGLFTLGIFN